jgi:hypothetical protein
MIDRQSIRLYEPTQAHKALASLWMTIKAALIAGHALSVELRAETRSTEQNRLLWSSLSDVARQVDWYGQKLSPEDWKCIFTASLKHQRTAPGIEGGFVVLGDSTSKMTKAEMGELIDLIHAFGDDKGVRWRVTSLGREWAEVAA